MKLYEFIVTYDNSTEVYKDYRYFKSLKECKEYIARYGMDVVRVKVANDVWDEEILKNAKEELENREL